MVKLYMYVLNNFSGRTDCQGKFLKYAILNTPNPSKGYIIYVFLDDQMGNGYTSIEHSDWIRTVAFFFFIQFKIY